MHITILALGSYGDVLPYTILGKGLKATGHQVRFVTFENFEPLVAAQGLDFHPIRGDVQNIMSGTGGGKRVSVLGVGQANPNGRRSKCGSGSDSSAYSMKLWHNDGKRRTMIK